MNAERLLALYEKVAEAPDAVPRLRRFVLDLAVRGKLVAQDAGEEPASELLKRIAAEKARLVKAGALKAERKPKEPSVPVELFELPCGWAWANLQSICLSISDGDHQPPPKAEAGVPFLVISDVRTKTINYDAERKVPHEYFDGLDPIRKPRPGDLLYTLVGSFGIPVPVQTDTPFCIQRHIGILRPSKQVELRALALFLESEFAFKQAEAAATGIAQKTVSLSGLRSLVLPLPPLAEQQRIVAKVEELMALLDRLEAARGQREATRDRLTAASLARLIAPDVDAADLPSNARFALATLPALTTRPDQIKPLRQTILNLAVRGNLVAQDPTDEPASELLKRIALAPKKAMRGRNTSSGEERIDPPYELPAGWEWSTFGALPIDARVGLDRGKAQQGPELKFGYFKMNNIANDGGMDLLNLSRIDASEDEVENFSLESGDFLFNTRNSRELVGKTCVFHSTGTDVVLFNNNILRAKFHPDVRADFVDLWFRSPVGKDLIEGLKSNTTNVCAIYQGKLLSYQVPLPPLAEQHRIVAKVDALMALCDRLEAALTTTNTTRARLLEALLHEALEPAAKAVTEAAE
ncbi:restriction endonuclease subunit S [Ruegeria pomeroyi]|nr:restriction endonuclease subunit S [Ruegeria pomeroyi]